MFAPRPSWPRLGDAAEGPSAWNESVLTSENLMGATSTPMVAAGSYSFPAAGPVLGWTHSDRGPDEPLSPWGPCLLVCVMGVGAEEG